MDNVFYLCVVQLNLEKMEDWDLHRDFIVAKLLEYKLAADPEILKDFSSVVDETSFLFLLVKHFVWLHENLPKTLNKFITRVVYMYSDEHKEFITTHYKDIAKEVEEDRKKCRKK